MTVSCRSNGKKINGQEKEKRTYHIWVYERYAGRNLRTEREVGFGNKVNYFNLTLGPPLDVFILYLTIFIISLLTNITLIKIYRAE
jgi:hypothetical protein